MNNRDVASAGSECQFTYNRVIWAARQAGVVHKPEILVNRRVFFQKSPKGQRRSELRKDVINLTQLAQIARKANGLDPEAQSIARFNPIEEMLHL